VTEVVEDYEAIAKRVKELETERLAELERKAKLAAEEAAAEAKKKAKENPT
jgi:hypothetical protein